ncbi:hypothetical protein LSM04_008562 [Trypanosoma melophagium]|uniref:uncharacterized protein n=1 Tax=Trypanosoma melophagium TaxID=715481 RepID=UPI00351A064C|nr:hypothetical protein LSM04_008562 [Trypanosoma melophagium]
MSFLIKTLLGDGVVHPPENGGDKGKSSGQEEEGKQRVPTRTLILRIQSCTVAQDRRDALKELQSCTDLPYVMAAKEVSYLCNVLRNFPDDEEIVESSLAVLSGITDLAGYPSVPSTYNVSEKEKRRIRDSFLHELISEVPLFLTHVNKGSFWSRFHSVQMLQRLEEYDSSAVHKLLLSSHGIGVLVDILNDNTHGGALRNEGLVLFTAITAADTELQTLLAFDNAFETLFSVVKEEGGLDGGVIVSDCLTIVHNMLRNNKATQKLFREMGCARSLCSLIESVPENVKIALKNIAAQKKHGINDEDNSETSFTPLSNVQSVVVLMAVSILSCLLREAEAHQEGPTAQDSLLQSGVLGPLASLALVGAAVDDAARVEAMRTLAVLLNGRRVGIEKFLQLQVVTLLRGEAPTQVEEWTALRALLHFLLKVEDRVMQSAAAQTIYALLSVPACEGRVGSILIKGFPSPSSSSLSSSTMKTNVAMVGPQNTLTLDCGSAISSAIFGSSRSTGCDGKYYAALLLERLLCIPSVVEEIQLSEQRESTTLPMPKQASMSPETDNVFITYVQYVSKCFRGQGEMDLNTLSACFRALLRWIMNGRKAVLLFLSNVTYYKAFLQRAGQDNGPVHVRFWAAVLCAALCVTVTKEKLNVTCDDTVPEGQKKTEKGSKNEIDDTTSSLSSTLGRRQLLELFLNYLGGPAVFDSLLFDVKASSPVWSDPPRNAFLKPTPVLYDENIKAIILDIIKDFNGICPSRGRIHEMQRSTSLDDGVIPSAHASTSEEMLYSSKPLDLYGNSAVVNTLLQRQSLPGVELNPETHDGGVFLQPKSFGEATPEMGADGGAAAALRDAYESQIQTLTQRNTELECELQLLRDQIKFDAEQREAAAAQDANQSEEVESLREHIRVLEEALGAEEEERRLLAESLNMLEAQLREARGAAGDVEALALREEVRRVREERDELLVLAAELAESPAGRPPTAPSPSPPLPPPSAAPSVAPQQLKGEGDGAHLHHLFPVGETESTPSQAIAFDSPEPNDPIRRLSTTSAQQQYQQQQQEIQQQQPQFQMSCETPFQRIEANGHDKDVFGGNIPVGGDKNPFANIPSDDFMNNGGGKTLPEEVKKQPAFSSRNQRNLLPMRYNPFANMSGLDDDDPGDLR